MGHRVQCQLVGDMSMEYNTIYNEAILEYVKLLFSMRFGTYTEHDTVKITEVFNLLNEIEEILTEEPNDKN